MTTTDPTESVRGAIRAARVGDPAPAINLDTLGPTDSELENPTPLAEQIAREHYLTTRAKCACPDALDAGGDMHAWVAHIATVTERAARIARGEVPDE